MTVVTVAGPVRVKDDPETFEMAIPPAAMAAVAPSGVAVQKYVAVEVNAGEIPVIVAVDGVALDKGTVPVIMRSLRLAVFAQAVVVPHSRTDCTKARESEMVEPDAPAFTPPVAVVTPVTARVPVRIPLPLPSMLATFAGAAPPESIF
jgi:hypothetical protein